MRKMRRIALVALLAGCHTTDYNSNHHTIDAGGSSQDGGNLLADATPVPGTATMTVDDTGLDPNVTATHKIIFQHEDGTVFFEADPDGSGAASHEVIAGDMITVATVFASPGDGSTYYTYYLYTVTGVHPGDHLVDADGAFQSANTYTTVGDAIFTVTPFTQTLPVDAGSPAYYYYSADMGCGSFGIYDPTQPYDYSIQPACVSSTNMVHGLGAVTDSNGALAASALVSSAWNTSPDAGYPTVDLALDSWTTKTGFSLAYANIPTSAYQVSLDSFVTTDGLDLHLPGFSLNVVPGDSGTLSLPYDATTFADVDYTISVRGNGPMQTYEEKVPSTTRSLDLKTSLLPRILFTSVDTFGDARPAIRWLADADLAPADGGFLSINFQNTYWDVVVAGTESGDLRLPALPADIDPAFTPPADYNLYPQVEFYESSDVAGYAAFRVNPEALFGPNKTGATIRTTSYSLGGG